MFNLGLFNFFYRNIYVEFVFYCWYIGGGYMGKVDILDVFFIYKNWSIW